MTVDLVRHRALMQRQHEHVHPFSGQCSLDCYQTAAEPRPLEQHVIFRDRVADAPDQVDEGEQRAMWCNKTGQRVAAYSSRAGTEKLLGGGVDELNMPATIDHENGIRKSRQDNRRFDGATVAHVRRRLAPTPTPQGHGYAAGRASSGS